MNKLTEQTITFAAICQVAQMVQHIARKNQLDDALFDIMLKSITNMNPNSTLDVYGNELSNVEQGLQTLVTQLGDSSATKDPELTRYIVCLLNLERRLSSKSRILQQLGDRIEQCNRQLVHFELNSDNMHASLASIYTDIISPLGTKIQIAGEPNILKQVSNQNRIRSLLLAGVRAAVLWRQVGGKRRNILFQRRKIVNEASALLKQI